MRDKKRLCKILEKACVEPNNCKYLDSKERTKFFMWFRNREENECYYLINLKGNYIRGYRYQYLYEDGSSENLFMLGLEAMLSGKEPTKIPKTHKNLLSKTLYKDYTTFIYEFMDKTEDLYWWVNHKEDEGEEDE